MTRIFLDTEFTGLHQYTSLISVGLAADNGDVFYAELTDLDREQVTPWLHENVMPLLTGGLTRAEYARTAPVMLCSGTRTDVARALRRWLKRFGGENSVEVWADVLAWDWVLFCEMFGALPEQVHYIPRDLSTLLWAKGIDPDTTREDLGSVTWSHPKLNLARHHALYDALLERDIFQKINAI